MIKKLKRMFKRKPIVIVNFKTYKQGRDVLKLARVIERVDNRVIVGVPASEISDVSDKTKLRVFAEHVDCFDVGRGTGYIMPEAVKEQGAVGVFLNHSEHPLKFDVLKKSISRCRGVGLKTAVFVKDVKWALKVEKLKVDYLIYEPPELVGGKKSVSKGRVGVVSEIVGRLRQKVLVGAGVKSREDVVKALELGAVGVAVSSGVVKARNPGVVLRELVGR